MGNKIYVDALQKGLDVLTCFDRTHSRLTISEVARRTGHSPASARRSLFTLQTLGYLETDGKRFWIGHRSLLVASSYFSSRPLPSLAQPLLDGLSERTRESATLAKLLDQQVIVIARSTARRSLSVGLTIGSRLPVYCSALGRVLLASLPAHEARAMVGSVELRRLAPRTPTTLNAVLSRVAACRADGYATSDEELELGVRSMAVPVFNRNGQTVAGLSIAMRADRMGPKEFVDAFLPALRRAQARLAEKLFVE
ncbi:MAG: helix-turn-helix domain-containing protein [Burkholderiales bacterium]|nr:helix-turn-helix domain-containing protein [Burkholderiales bacterium]